jgi:hypothetical protein
MRRSITPIVSLEEAKARFEEWRKIRQEKARIPAELWSAAVEVARKEGINRTARELHVAWDDLKRRLPQDQCRSNRPSWSWSRRRCNRFPNARWKWKVAGESLSPRPQPECGVAV